MKKKKSWLHHVNLFLRSLLFSFISLSVIFFYSFWCLVSYAFPLSVRYRSITGFTAFTIWLLKVICHVDYRVEGLENIPKDRNGVVLSKHQSTWETFFLPTLFHQAAIILKRELFWVPFFGWGLASIAPIAINRNDASSSMEQILVQGTKYLQEGRWILVFPEGTRIAPGKVGHYRAGGARLAVKAGYPVVPVAHNAGRYWSKRKFIKQPGTIQVVIGPLIETDGKTADQVLAETKQWIESTMVRIDSKGK